jgi:hypothetical protein
MQALDSFISPIHGFDRDVPILAIPVLTQSLGNEITSDPSAGVVPALQGLGWANERLPLTRLLRKSQEVHGEILGWN